MRPYAPVERCVKVFMGNQHIFEKVSALFSVHCSVAVVIFCCGGYILLLWLYSVAVVIFCCSGYILLQWLYSVAVVIFCQRDYFRMKLTCSYTSQCYSTYSSYSLISLLKFLPCLHHPSTPPTNTTFLPEPFEGILEQ